MFLASRLIIGFRRKPIFYWLLFQGFVFVYFDLARMQGVTYNRIDALEELAISASPDAFLPTRINIGASAASKVMPYTPGAYLNYDLSLTNSPGMRSTQGLFDIALFRGEGFRSGFS